MSTDLEHQARELAAQMRNESILRDSNEAVNGAIRLIEAALAASDALDKEGGPQK